jgi:hypothetical protein
MYSLVYLLFPQAEKQGWNYHVDKEHKERIPPKSYGTLTIHPTPLLSLVAHLSNSPEDVG